MKAFLLAAGNGTRLRPLTDAIPKCLIPVRGVPLLQVWLELCKRSGVDEILVNLHSHAELVRQYLAHNGNGIRVHLVEEPQLLGSAGTLRTNREWVAAEECYWIFYADVLNCADLENMLILHRSRRPVATLGIYRVPNPASCGIVTVGDDGIIEKFIEKPTNPVGDLAFSGLMIGTPELMEIIPDRIPSDIGFDVLPLLTGRMLAYPINDYLIDIGTMENYLTAQATWPGLGQDSRCRVG